MKKILWFLFGLFSVFIGIYPLAYFLVDMNQGFLGGKSDAIKESQVWFSFFYTHIVFGAFALLSGWTQFSSKIRKNRLSLHRLLGKIYAVSVLISGISGIYLAFYATGGVISGFGFGTMSTLWLATTIMAYLTMRNGQINIHENSMIRSYAVCWAAVTLRLWLPSLQMFFGMDFMPAYLLVSWLCWVPNLMIAEWVIKRKQLTIAT